MEYRKHLLWFTTQRPADAKAEKWVGNCLYNFQLHEDGTYMCIGDRQVGYSNSRHNDVSDANEDADLADWPHGWDLHSPSTKGMDHLLQMGYGKAPYALRASLGDAFGTRLATESIPESLISAVSQKDLGEFLHMCRQAEDETADAHSLVPQEHLQMHPFLSPMPRQLYRYSTGETPPRIPRQVSSLATAVSRHTWRWSLTRMRWTKTASLCPGTTKCTQS